MRKLPLAWWAHARTFTHFALRDLFILVAICAVLIAWYLDHQQLATEISQERYDVRIAREVRDGQDSHLRWIPKLESDNERLKRQIEVLTTPGNHGR